MNMDQRESRTFLMDLVDREPDRFNACALDLFREQSRHNPVYRDYLRGIGFPLSDQTATRQIDASLTWSGIPALPIRFFRSHEVITRTPEGPVEEGPILTFLSSGSTNDTASRHFVLSPDLYLRSFVRGFERQYGKPENWTMLFLLPSYLEREGSSLVYMCRELASRSLQPESGFFLHNTEELIAQARSSLLRGQPTIILGVTYALLDLAETQPAGLEKVNVVETGGMKGRREELIREEVHDRLSKGLGVPRIHSEYGMTELLSQAWSSGEGLFHPPPWMRIRIRDLSDPLVEAPAGQIGAIDVIDLANAYSCAFVATDDLGRLHADGSFQVLGRMDNSEIRGCNLLLG